MSGEIPFMDAHALMHGYYCVHSYQLRNLARHCAARSNVCPWCGVSGVRCEPCLNDIARGNDVD